MKNSKIWIGIMIVVVLIGGYFGFRHLNNRTTVKTDAEKFKQEYEELNGLTNESSIKYKELTISSENPIVYADYDKVFEILEGTGVIYFGFPECPWCRTTVPVLLEAAEEIGLEEIYYLNNLESRDIKKLVDGELVTEKEAANEYHQLLEKLGIEFTEEYKGLNDESIRRLYFPTVVVVKDGVIIESISGSVDSQENPYVALTDEQTKELKDNYKNAIDKLYYCGEC